jgi:hypothetical protein
MMGMGRRRRSRALALGLLLTVSACSRDCGCISGDKSYESLDGKVKVELVRRVHWSGNHMVAAPSSRFLLRVHTTPPIEHPVGCSHVDMAENEAGTLVAYRCRDGKAWTVLRLRGGSRCLVECEAPVGEGDGPDFAALPALRDSVDRILECAENQYDEGEVWGELVRSMAEEDGAAAAAKLAVRLFEAPPPKLRDDPWVAIIETLEPDAAAQVKRAVCAKLADAETSDLSYERAGEICPHAGTPIANEALRRFTAALTEKKEITTAQRWAASIAIRNDPKRAGEVGCASLGKLNMANETASRFALGAIAIGETRCEGLWSAQAWDSCSSGFDCGDGLCTAEVTKRVLDEWIRSVRTVIVEGKDKIEERSPIVPPDYVIALLGAGYAQGELPREMVLRNARLRYRLPDPGGPSCTEDLPSGTPCECKRFDETKLCRFKASDREGTLGRCHFRFDDGQEKIVDMRRQCQSKGEICRYRSECCPGLDCGVPPGTQVSQCHAPKPDASGDGETADPSASADQP